MHKYYKPLLQMISERLIELLKVLSPNHLTEDVYRRMSKEKSEHHSRICSLFWGMD